MINLFAILTGLACKIQKWRARRIMAGNKNPRVYKVWEHNGWGDRISVRKVNNDGTFRIDGHLMTKPMVGDIIVYDANGGKAKGVVSDTEYPGDPLDMFFATVIPVELYKEV